MTSDSAPSLPRRLAAEGVGTALLLATVVGSGIMAETLAGGNVALALLCNTLATGGGLVALILTFGPVSGAHFNPAVSLTALLARRLGWREAAGYLLVQLVGALLGVWLAHAMFGKPVLMISQHLRAGFPQGLSEAVATFGLLCTILGTARHRAEMVPFAVGAYITAAYWFTASTSFANPAVTVARSLTDTFAGIRPADVPLFVAAQLTGAVVAAMFFRWLWPSREAASISDRATAPSAPITFARSK
jgi:glycerol uptake facilitator-like aquaporin